MKGLSSRELCWLFGLLFVFTAGVSEAVKSKIVSVQFESFLIRSWQVGDGLPANQVRDVLQTCDGFIWVATLNGVARFNGVDFIRYDVGSVPELINNQVVKLYEDAAGNLFMGHATGHISVWSHSGVTALDCSESWLQGGEVVNFFEEPNGSVWAENTNGDFLPLVGPCLSDEAGASFVKPLNRWIVQDERIVKFDADGVEKETRTIPWGIKKQTIHLLERTNGDLIAGSTFGGIFMIHAGTSNVTQITLREGLASTSILCLAEDAEKTLWVGTTAGLQSIRAMDYTAIEGPIFGTEKWKFQSIRSVVPRIAGGVWVGTNRGQLFSSVGKSLARVEETTHAVEIRRTILEAQDGNVWINDDAGFLMRLADQKLCAVKAKNDEGDEIWALHETGNGKLWAGGRKGLWTYSTTGGWSMVVGRNKGVSAVQCLTSESDGTLWVGMEFGGLASWKDNQLVHWTTESGLPNEHITALCTDEDDNSLWIGSAGGGLILFKNGIFQKVPFSQDIVSYIMDDRDGRLWVVGERGLVIVEKKDIEHALTTGREVEIYMLYDKEDGLGPAIDIGVGLSSACRTPDGRFWYASDRQLSVFQPSEVQLWTNPVPLVINHALVNDQMLSLEGADSMVLGPGVHRLDIHFSALSFISPNRMHFRCRISGLGNEWTELGTRRVASYQHIPPGQYRFELTAANRDGIWNPSPFVLKVVVNPYIWETWWFKTLVYLSIGMFTAFVSLVVVDRINRRKLIRSEQRRAVEEERTRISMDIHDGIGSELTRLQLLCHRISILFDKSGNEAGQGTIVEIDHVTDKLIRTFDETVWVVNPGNDNVNNLVGYLSKYIEHYLREMHISCDLDVSLTSSTLPVSGPIRHNLFLSIKEALNNAVKHAEATKIRFVASVEDKVLKLALHDNGKGIEVQAPERFQRGLRSMRRRMKLIGGTFAIRNNAAGGTTVEFKLDIRARRLTDD